VPVAVAVVVVVAAVAVVVAPEPVVAAAAVPVVDSKNMQRHRVQSRHTGSQPPRFAMRFS